MAKVTINNGDSGATVRAALNAMFTELYALVPATGYTLVQELIDTTPDAFTIPDKTGQATSTAIESDEVFPTGYNSPIAITITSGTGQYRIRSVAGTWGSYTSSAGTLNPGESFMAKVTSSSSAVTAVSLTISLGTGITDTYTVTTGAAAPFAPSDLTTGKWAWIDHSNAASITLASGKVSQITDRFGLSRNALQASATNRPSITAAAQNGLDVGEYVNIGLTDVMYLTLPDMSALTAGSIYFVAKRTVTPGTSIESGSVVYTGSHGDSNHYPLGDGNIYLGDLSTVRKTVGAPTTTLLAWHIGEIRSESGAWSFWINGVQQFATATNTVGGRSNPLLGATYSPTNFVGQIGEVILLSEVPSAGNIAKLQGYLSWKWTGSGALLPTGHTYKSVAP